MMASYAEEVRQALQMSEWAKQGGAIDQNTCFRLLAECFARRRMKADENPTNKMIFIGNGGSAAIAEHMATDYTKAGGIRAQAFNSGSLLTCLANDHRFEEVFARAVNLYADPRDILVAVSSSGMSQDILLGAEAGREKNCVVVTLSGFNADNPLRRLGNYNIYVPSSRYGIVEIAHYMILHALLDHIAGDRV